MREPPLESIVNMATMRKTAIDTEGVRDHQPSGSDAEPVDASLVGSGFPLDDRASDKKIHLRRQNAANTPKLTGSRSLLRQGSAPCSE